MNEISSKPIQHFRKGDAFVEMAPRPLVFMEINEVDKSTENMDFCIVTWYMLDEKGLNAQRRFPMAARDGKFSDFEPISRRLLKEAKSLMRQYDADVKLLTEKKEVKSLYQEYNRKLIELLPDAEDRLELAQHEEKKIITNKWLNHFLIFHKSFINALYCEKWLMIEMLEKCILLNDNSFYLCLK